MRSVRSFLSGFALLALASGIAPAAAGPALDPNRAGAINVDASTLALSRAKMSGSIRVESRKDAPDLVQVHVYAWSQKDGQDELAPTDDLIGLPLVFTLPPNGTQTVRVGIRGAIGGQQELAYRVIVGEVPTDQRVRSGLETRLAFNFPVYVAPLAAVNRSLQWSVQRLDQRHLRVTAQNTGNVHVAIQHVALSDGARASKLAELDARQAVLAGQQWSWTVATSAAVVPADPVLVEATTDAGTLRAQVP
jgi:fimbrial chaperone protein